MDNNDFIAINCPVCSKHLYRELFSIQHHKSNVLKLLEIQDRDRPVKIVKCNNCGHCYMTPVINDHLMARYYSILNSEFYDLSAKEAVNINQKEYEDYAELLKSIKPFGKVLEIGCGKGFLLKQLEEKGYDCYGVEPSPFASAYASKQLGLKVENSFLSNSSYNNTKFDIVILIDVMEHISNTESIMKDIVHVMNDGAIIFIGTGNIDSLNARLAGPNWNYFVSWEHLSFFNNKSMHMLLKNHGFNSIVVRKTSLQHKPLLNLIEFCKNIIKKIVNPFLKSKFYHGVCFDHFIVTAIYQSTRINGHGE